LVTLELEQSRSEIFTVKESLINAATAKNQRKPVTITASTSKYIRSLHSSFKKTL